VVPKHDPFEKSMIKIATRGVVTLFNAVSQQQKNIRTEEEDESKKGKDKNQGGTAKVGGGSTAAAAPVKTTKYKILLIGDSAAGKSSVLLRYVDNTFSDAFISNIGSEYKEKTIAAGGSNAKLQIWDTGGQERFRTITSSFYQGAHGVIVMYDITNQETWASVQKWVQEADRYAPEAAKLLVGNKVDLASERQVQSDEANEYCETLEIPYIETSAKDGTNIEAAFLKMAECIHDKAEHSAS